MHSLIRKIVRQFILEGQSERNQLAGHAKRLRSEIESDWEQKIPSKDHYMNHEMMLDEKYFYAYHGRRDIKSHWNKRAYATPERKAFWAGGPGAKIKSVHWIGFIKKPKNDTGLLKRLKRYVEREYSSTSPELSAVGYVDSEIWPHGSIGVWFQTRKITWAYLADSLTEFISSVGQQASSRFGSGKIPKRPYLGINKSNCILGPDDMKGSVINEVIISRYSDPIFILHSKKLSLETLETAKKIIVDGGYKFKIIS